MVICLERGADLHIAQLMPLPLTVSCFSKIQTGFTFLVPVHLGSPGQRAVKRVCVCVCAYKYIYICTLYTYSRPTPVCQWFSVGIGEISGERGSGIQTVEILVCWLLSACSDSTRRSCGCGCQQQRRPSSVGLVQF